MWKAFKFLVDRFHQQNPGRQILSLRFEDRTDAGAIEDGRGYFEVWARRLFLADERAWFHGQYPTVQAFFTFAFGSGGGAPVTIGHAAGPEHLAQVDKDHLNRVIAMNHLLCGPVPFRSGSVEVEIALVATKIDDDLSRFLHVVGDFSQLVAIPQLSTALNVATKVADGVEQLAHADGNTLVTGVDATFVGANGGASDQDYVLRNSLFLAVNAAADEFDQKDLHFSDGQVLHKGAPLKGVDWLLVEINTFPHRPNLVDALPAIGGPLNKAIEALANVSKGDTTGPDLLYRGAVVAALTSDDLIQTDRLAAVDEIQKRYAEAKSILADQKEGAPDLIEALKAPIDSLKGVGTAGDTNTILSLPSSALTSLLDV